MFRKKAGKNFLVLIVSLSLALTLVLAPATAFARSEIESSVAKNEAMVIQIDEVEVASFSGGAIDWILDEVFPALDPIIEILWIDLAERFWEVLWPELNPVTGEYWEYTPWHITPCEVNGPPEFLRLAEIDAFLHELMELIASWINYYGEPEFPYTWDDLKEIWEEKLVIVEELYGEVKEIAEDIDSILNHECCNVCDECPCICPIIPTPETAEELAEQAIGVTITATPNPVRVDDFINTIFTVNLAQYYNVNWRIPWEAGSPFPQHSQKWMNVVSQEPPFGVVFASPNPPSSDFIGVTSRWTNLSFQSWLPQIWTNNFSFRVIEHPTPGESGNPQVTFYLSYRLNPFPNMFIDAQFPVVVDFYCYICDAYPCICECSGCNELLAYCKCCEDCNVHPCVCECIKCNELLADCKCCDVCETYPCECPIPVNRDYLAEAIRDGEGINLDRYTPESRAALEQALANANQVYNNPNATQTQIDNATQALRDAINSLEPVLTPPAVVPLWRMYHEGIMQHLWTTCYNEYNVLVDRGWVQEGVAWYTPSTGVPVHRLFHEGIVRHHYTADQHEISVLVQRGWNNEGVLFYCASTVVDEEDRTAMTRLFHEGALKHLHTADANEVRVLSTYHGWRIEGISFYGLRN